MPPAATGSGGAVRLPSGRGRHKHPREFVVHSQRERLLDGMAKAVSRKGYKAATVADVIEIAGVSRKTFYENFSDKEDCYLAAYDAIVPTLVERVDEGYHSTEESWGMRIRAGLGALLEFMAAEPDFARACIVEVMAAGPTAVARRDVVMQGLAGYFDPGRPEMDRQDVVHPDLVAESVVHSLHGFIYSRITRDQIDELPELLPQATYVALLPYMDEEEAREIARG